MPYLLGDRRNDLRVQLRLQAAHERELQRTMQSELKRVAESVADDVEDTGNVHGGVQGHDQRIQNALESGYRGVMPAFGQRILDAASDKRFRGRETKRAETEFDQSMQNWIRTTAALKVRQISDTTMEQIRSKLEAGRRQGLSTSEIARSMRDELGGVVASTRAAIIARTEIHSAAQAANRQAADATGIQGLRKEWLAADDSRTRPDHDAADGQVVDKEAEFSVGGVNMNAPGDPGAPPEQTVNCRCAQTLITPDD